MCELLAADPSLVPNNASAVAPILYGIVLQVIEVNGNFATHNMSDI